MVALTEDQKMSKGRFRKIFERARQAGCNFLIVFKAEAASPKIGQDTNDAPYEAAYALKAPNVKAALEDFSRTHHLDNVLSVLRLKKSFGLRSAFLGKNSRSDEIDKICAQIQAEQRARDLDHPSLFQSIWEKLSFD